MANVWCVILILFALFHANKHIGVAAKCNCPKVHTQTTFCNADFAVFAKVVAKVRNPLTVIYLLCVKKVYNVSDGLQNIVKNNKKLVVISKLTPCVSNLEVNRSYYLTGAYDPNNFIFEIDICQLQLNISVINKIQKWGVITDYKKICETCTLPNDKCPYTPNNLDCYSRYALCSSKKAEDPCSWLSMSEQKLATCLDNSPQIILPPNISCNAT